MTINLKGKWDAKVCIFNNNNNNLFLIERYLQWQINSALQLVSLNIKISTNSKNINILQLTWLYKIHNFTTIEELPEKKSLNWILKISTDSILRYCNGSSFHRCGAAAWNARSPGVASILPLGGSNKIPELDLRLYEDLCLINKRLLIYAGARPWMALKANNRILKCIRAGTGNQCNS